MSQTLTTTDLHAPAILQRLAKTRFLSRESPIAATPLGFRCKETPALDLVLFWVR